VVSALSRPLTLEDAKCTTNTSVLNASIFKTERAYNEVHVLDQVVRFSFNFQLIKWLLHVIALRRAYRIVFSWDHIYTTPTVSKSAAAGTD
jgi:hypothetical protein